MSQIVEVRKTIAIRAAVGNVAQFNYDINNIPFIPDELIIRQFVFYDGAGGVEVASIFCPELVSEPLFSFSAPANSSNSSALDLTYPLKKPVQGRYTFQFTQYNGALLTLNAGSYLHFHVEFVKYKPPVY